MFSQLILIETYLLNGERRMGWMIVDTLEVAIGFIFNLFAHHLRHVEDLGHVHWERIEQSKTFNINK